jgi:hypothetical protein
MQLSLYVATFHWQSRSSSALATPQKCFQDTPFDDRQTGCPLDSLSSAKFLDVTSGRNLSAEIAQKPFPSRQPLDLIASSNGPIQVRQIFLFLFFCLCIEGFFFFFFSSTQNRDLWWLNISNNQLEALPSSLGRLSQTLTDFFFQNVEPFSFSLFLFRTPIDEKKKTKQNNPHRIP